MASQDMTSSIEGEIRFLFDVPVGMRDGVKLSADVYLPAEGEQHPTILQRIPYDNTRPIWLDFVGFLSRRGYAVVTQDVRGRCDSEGEWEPFMNEAQDGYDTIEWIAEQPWSNGKVGMMWASYGGLVQWMAARERPPHLVTLVSTAAAGRWMQEFPYMNGKIMLFSFYWLIMVGGHTVQVNMADPMAGSPVNWKKILLHRPTKELGEVLGRTNTVWRKWLEHSTYDDYWRQPSLEGYFEEIDLPVLHITGWYDGDQWGELYYYNNMIAHSPAADKQYLLSGPWNHGGTVFPRAQWGGLDFTQGSVVDIKATHLRWFDYWLKGKENGLEEEPRVRIFVMGRNEWREEEAWPLPDTQVTPYYFHSGGRANSLGGDGRLNPFPPDDEPTDSYVYNPDHPTPSYPDLDLFPYGEFPLDERYVERRDDVLVYTSEVLEEELEVTGTPFVVLYAASDAVDTDFAAVLTDVHPDGRSVPLAEGILRASFRDSLEEPTLLTPGVVYEYRIELNATSIAVLSGHRIRVSILSCRFPSWDRNPNTGAPVGEDEEIQLATQTVYHDNGYPSHILLPIIPPRAANEEV
jgi:putative CocE/NonD family hydrolase